MTNSEAMNSYRKIPFTCSFIGSYPMSLILLDLAGTMTFNPLSRQGAKIAKNFTVRQVVGSGFPLQSLLLARGDGCKISLSPRREERQGFLWFSVINASVSSAISASLRELMCSGSSSRQGAKIAKHVLSIVWHHDQIDLLSSCLHFLLDSVDGAVRVPCRCLLGDPCGSARERP